MSEQLRFLLNPEEPVKMSHKSVATEWKWMEKKLVNNKEVAKEKRNIPRMKRGGSMIENKAAVPHSHHVIIDNIYNMNIEY